MDNQNYNDERDEGQIIYSNPNEDRNGYQEYRDPGTGQYQNPNPGPAYYPPAKESSGFAVASLVLGIISLILCCTGINFILSILSIVFGILHLVKHQNRKGMAIAGIILSVISIVIFIILVVIGLYAISSGLLESISPDMYNDLLNQL